MPQIFPFRGRRAGTENNAQEEQGVFERVVAPQVEHLYRLAYRLTGSRHDAEDLVQDLLVRLYARRAALGELEEPRTWLARSLYNLYIDGVRGRQRSPVGLAERDSEMLLDTIADGAPPPEVNTERYLLQRRLIAALAALNDEQRAVVSLHDMEGYTLPELETILATPLGTLKSRLHRARQTLKEKLLEEPFSPAERVNA